MKIPFAASAGKDFLVPCIGLGIQFRKEHLPDCFQLLPGCHAIRRRFQHSLCKLPLETGDTYHEKFIEIVGKDRKELHPFQKRVGFIPCFVKNMPVEPYPAQFTVDIE